MRALAAVTWPDRSGIVEAAASTWRGVANSESKSNARDAIGATGLDPRTGECGAVDAEEGSVDQLQVASLAEDLATRLTTVAEDCAARVDTRQARALHGVSSSPGRGRVSRE